MTINSPAKRNVFLSHSNKHRAFVTRLAAILKRHGIQYWYSGTDIVGAQQWHDEIGRALAGSNWFLLVLTPDSVRSEWVKRELFFALDQQRYRNRIIPLLRKRCNPKKLSWTLNSFERVDFTDDFAAGCRQLLRIWNIEFKAAPGPSGSGSRAKAVRNRK
jgi:hypothetical protein